MGGITHTRLLGVFYLGANSVEEERVVSHLVDLESSGSCKNLVLCMATAEGMASIG